MIKWILSRAGFYRCGLMLSIFPTSCNSDCSSPSFYNLSSTTASYCFFLLEQCLGMHSAINCGDKTTLYCVHIHPVVTHQCSQTDSSLWQDSSWEACPCVNPTFVHRATNWLLGSSNDGRKSWRNQLG